MRILVIVRNVGSEKTWKEELDAPTLAVGKGSKTRAREYVKSVIKAFNDATESKREALTARILGPSTTHVWQKSNLVTIKKGNSMYDVMRCINCGVMGKRYGFTSVRADKKSQIKCKKGL